MTFRFLTGMNSLLRFLTALSFGLIVCITAGSVMAGKKKTSPPLPSSSLCQKKIRQGVKGTVLFLKGNHMPSPDKATGSPAGVAREIGFFELTRIDQAQEGQDAGFYKNLKTKLIKRTHSGKDGCFAVRLKPGRYSMLVKEKGEWYANSLGGNGEIHEVVVAKDTVTEIQFRITYAAVF
jgi:hypothetical protein